MREVASLWHPPGAADETPLVERSGAKVLPPFGARSTGSGAPVGETTPARAGTIRFPDDLLRRHHLYVARTRMGKSTLMGHLVAHKLREKAAGRDGDAIVVVDPHADLVGGLLEDVPESLVDQVRLVDLASEERAPGINLLDTRVFSDRDRTADSVVRVARGLWEQWGPRMQSILEQTVKTLHEANTAAEPEDQYTILDGLRLLSDEALPRQRARLRGAIPTCWTGGRATSGAGEGSTAPRPSRPCRRASPTTPPPSGRAPSSASPAPPSTCAAPSSTAASSSSPPPRARPGATWPPSWARPSSISSTAVIREQERLPLDQRRGALVVVDEMQSMPGVDYESMLSELGKYGASFVLATQSLAKLADLSPTMQDTVLANTGCLAVFQVAGSDARKLVWELGRDRVSEEDIVSLPVHHCYVRATVGTERMPAFSMKVLKPEGGDPQLATRLRSAAADYTTPARDIAERDAGSRERVTRYRDGLDALASGTEPLPAPGPENSPLAAPERRKQRSRRNRTGGAEAPPPQREEEP